MEFVSYIWVQIHKTHPSKNAFDSFVETCMTPGMCAHYAQNVNYIDAIKYAK